MSYPANPGLQDTTTNNKRPRPSSDTWSPDLPPVHIYARLGDGNDYHGHGPVGIHPGYSYEAAAHPMAHPQPEPYHPTHLTGPAAIYSHPDTVKRGVVGGSRARGRGGGARGGKRATAKASNTVERGAPVAQKAPPSASRRLCPLPTPRVPLDKTTGGREEERKHSLHRITHIPCSDEGDEPALPSMDERHELEDSPPDTNMSLQRTHSALPPLQMSPPSDVATMSTLASPTLIPTPTASTSGRASINSLSDNIADTSPPDTKILQDAQSLYALRGDYVCLMYIARLKALDIDHHDTRLGALLLALYEIVQERTAFSKHQEEIKKQLGETRRKMEALGYSEEDMGLEEAHTGVDVVLGDVWGYKSKSTPELGRKGLETARSGATGSGSREESERAQEGDGLFGDDVTVGAGYEDRCTSEGKPAILIPLTRKNGQFTGQNVQEMGRYLAETPMHVLSSLFGGSDD